MNEILTNAWIQAGAAGLFAVSGWMMWWLERKERLLVRERRDQLLEELLTFMNNYKDLLEKIAEGLALQKLLKEEFDKLQRLGK